jgi:hypothetical protein
LIVLASLSHHIIIGLHTNPALAPALQNLQVSLAARDVFIDNVREEYASRNKFIIVPTIEDGDFTAYTSAYSGIGEWGETFCWVSE